jgi:hypothetical protein
MVGFGLTHHDTKLTAPLSSSSVTANNGLSPDNHVSHAHLREVVY